MLDIEKHSRRELTYSEVSGKVQQEAQEIADAMCLAIASGMMQWGWSFGQVCLIVTKMEGRFRNLAVSYVTSNSLNPETYLLVTFGHVPMFADCQLKIVTGADELEHRQRELKRQGTLYMSFDASLTLEAAMLFVDSNRKDKRHDLQPKH